MKVKEIYPAKYLKGADLDEPRYLRTIVSIGLEEVTNLQGESERKPVVTFNEPVGAGFARKLIVNKTNLDMIADALGSDETDDWVGKEIEIVRETWAGKPVVRVAL